MDKKLVLKVQKGELTEHIIYKKLAGIVKNKAHSGILEKISAEELEHYKVFKSITGKESPPDKFRIFLYVFIARFLGLNFKKRFIEMTGLSLRIASATFLIGLAIRKVFGVDV
jgi:vacuolar iron transporter family protein